MSDWSDLESVFRAGGAPSHLVPFAHADGTWFMAFDLARKPPRVVEWDHESGAAEDFEGSFTDWLAAQLDEVARADHDDASADAEHRRCAVGHVPFCETTFGRQATTQIARPGGATLRDVLLDLHLQYIFHPRAVVNEDLHFIGLLHFTDTAIGCWRCGAMSQPGATRCPSCSEVLLLGTYAQSRQAPMHVAAREECFGIWAARYVDLSAPQPKVITSPMQPQGVPAWARLKAFGGTRDPRVLTLDPTVADWEPTPGDSL